MALGSGFWVLGSGFWVQGSGLPAIAALQALSGGVLGSDLHSTFDLPANAH